MQVLSKSFFQSRNTARIAKGLLGKFLVRKHKGKTRFYIITEVEAYDGFHDMASHAHRGKTERNKVMFGPAGYWYVYFTYGMHWMLNIVTGPEEYPAAVLIRGVKGINGPARLTKVLHVDRSLNGQPAGKKSGLWVEDWGVKLKPNQIKSASRVGVAYAGQFWSKRKWRFYVKI